MTTERRRQVLDAVRHAAEPLGVSEIANAVGLHPNTVRFHLRHLVTDGSVERVQQAPSGPGRPPETFRLQPGSARGQTRRYHEMAEVLLEHLDATSADPPAEAAAVGRKWGARLAVHGSGLRRSTAGGATRYLVTLLERLDFAPEVPAHRRGTGDRILLRHCPFLELAVPHRDLVCPMHLGLMQGVLAEGKAPITVTALEPFAETNACVARLAPRPEATGTHAD